MLVLPGGCGGRAAKGAMSHLKCRDTSGVNAVHGCDTYGVPLMNQALKLKAWTKVFHHCYLEFRDVAQNRFLCCLKGDRNVRKKGAISTVP